MNTPNKLTMIRMALIPVFLIILYIGFEYSNLAAMAVFIIASLTDIADGYIARKNSQVTDFGKFMDPIADKILVVAALLWFVDQNTIPAWVVLIVIIREFMVTALRLVAVENRRVIAAGLSGKIKTAVTMFSIIVMFLPLRQWMIYICIIAITVTTVISGVEYFIRNKDCLSWEK